MSELNMSVFRLYSIGTAAENMEFGKRTLEVWPSEQMPAVDGDVTTNQTNISTEGTDAQGQKYTQNINAGNVIEAEWLSYNSNRPFPSLIRRGEKVKIWRNSDTDQFYWTEMGTDIRYRRGDIYTIACISTIVNDDDPISHENSYWFELDSLNGVIRLSTTALNNEACKYLFEFMTREGTFQLSDSIGNYLKLESVDQRWTIMNAAETSLIMDGADTTLTMTGKYTVNAQDCLFNITNDFTIEATTKTENIRNEFSLNTVTATMKADTNYTVNSASITLNGPLSSFGFGGGAGSAKFQGTMDIEGTTTVQGDLNNNGIKVTGHNHQGDSGGQTGPMQ
jgi:hypothetical protein